MKSQKFDLSNSVSLPDFEALKYCLLQSQKNNGSQLITSTYLFFEIIVESLIKSKEIPPNRSHCFAFTVDNFEINNSVSDDLKKVPLQKIYPQSLKDVNLLNIDFQKLSQAKIG